MSFMTDIVYYLQMYAIIKNNDNIIGLQVSIQVHTLLNGCAVLFESLKVNILYKCRQS